MPTSASLVEPGIVDERSLIATLIGDNVGILTNGTTSVNRNSTQSNSLRRRGTRRLSSISIAQLSSLRKSSSSPNTKESEIRYNDRISELELANDVYRNILDQERKKLRSLSVKLELQQQLINMQNQEKELAELRLQRLYLQHSTYEHKQHAYPPIPYIPESTDHERQPQDNSVKVYGHELNAMKLLTLNNEESTKVLPEKSIVEFFDGPISDEEPERRQAKYSTQAKTTEDVFYLSDNKSSSQNTLLESRFPDQAHKIIKYSTESVSCYLLDEVCDKCKEKKKRKESGLKSHSGNTNNRHSAIIGNHLLEVDTARKNFFSSEVSEIDPLPNDSDHEQQMGLPEQVCHSQPVYQSICKVRYAVSAISKSSTGSITRAQPSVDAPTVSCRVGRTFNTPLGGLRESASPTASTEFSSYWSPLYSGSQDEITGSRPTMNKDTKSRTRPVIMGRSSVAAYQV